MLGHLGSLLPLEDIAAGARFLRSLPGFLRRPIGPDEARAALRRRLERREATVRLTMKTLKFDRQAAERTYDALLPGFDERGRLPAKGMPLFCELAVASGEVTEPWPEARFLDRRFIDTFDTWAPK